ncbi:hypothetical protein [Leifsonia sp. A12D58]|uniref:hypothetical protein n=1 Tax=Leifsonia sp. A12D58 TaxID=3397674 RepID=UPI0039E077E0
MPALTQLALAPAAASARPATGFRRGAHPRLERAQATTQRVSTHTVSWNQASPTASGL